MAEPPRIGILPSAPRDSLAEPLLDGLFDAAAEATEQAITDALFSAEAVVGFRGRVRHALTDVAPDWATLGL